MLNGKTILVTGGTGSFGHQFVNYVLKNYEPKKVIIYSRDEFKQFIMQNEYKSHPQYDKLTVITASLEVARILANDHNIDIIELGGILRHSSLSVVGKYAESALSDFSCSKLFIGVDGIDLDFGITTTDMMEASLNRVMIQTAQKTIVLADSSKFGRRGFSKIVDTKDVDHIITDSRISPSTAHAIEEMGIELTIVPVH